MKPAIYFDIETEALPFAEIEQFKPDFEAPANYKDADKIAAHKQAQLSKWLDECALSPMTGRVVAIGLETRGEFALFEHEDESIALKSFWSLFKKRKDDAEFVGFNIYHFDLPFIIRRSMRLGVTIPFGILPLCRFYEHSFVDLMDFWRAGQRQDRISLDNFAKFLGVGAKNGEGKHFAALLKEDKEKAIEYLQNDLRLVRRIHERLTLVAA